MHDIYCIYKLHTVVTLYLYCTQFK